MPSKHPYPRGDGGGSFSSTAIHLLTRGPGIKSPGPMVGPTTSYTDAMDVHLITSGVDLLMRDPAVATLLYHLLKEVLFTLEIVTEGSQQQRMRDF